MHNLKLGRDIDINLESNLNVPSWRPSLYQSFQKSPSESPPKSEGKNIIWSLNLSIWDLELWRPKRHWGRIEASTRRHSFIITLSFLKNKACTTSFTPSHTQKTKFSCVMMDCSRSKLKTIQPKELLRNFGDLQEFHLSRKLYQSQDSAPPFPESTSMPSPVWFQATVLLQTSLMQHPSWCP